MQKLIGIASEMSTAKSNAPVAISTLVTNDIDGQANAAKKKSKKKNKSKLTSTCEAEHATDDNHDAKQRTDDSEIQQMSQELLKRLQINGDTIKKSTAATTDGSQNGKLASGQCQAVNAMHSANKPVAEHVNHNNNNFKVSCNEESTGNTAKEALCNGASHESSDSQANETVSDVRGLSKRNLSSADKKETAISNKESTPSDDRSSNLEATAKSETIEPTQPAPPEPNTNEAVMGEAATAVTAPSRTVITYKEYENELQMPDIMRVIQRELSEPYSIYTYRYFIHNWPKLCFLAMDGDHCVGAIVCKLDIHRQIVKRGYIAMLAVEQAYRKLKVGTTLVQKAIEVGADRAGAIFHFYSKTFSNITFSVHLRPCLSTMPTKSFSKRKSPIFQRCVCMKI